MSAGLIEDAHDDILAMHRRQGGDTIVDLPAAEAQLETAVLRRCSLSAMFMLAMSLRRCEIGERCSFLKLRTWVIAPSMR